MSYHFIRHKPSGGLLTMVNTKSKPMYICFKSIHCAEHCMKHFARFKSDYGIWPTIDLSYEDSVTVHTPVNIHKQPMSWVYSKLEIDTIQEDELIKLGNVTGTPFMYCHEFGIIHDGSDKLNVAFSGQEYYIESDYEDYVRTLEEGIAG